MQETKTKIGDKLILSDLSFQINGILYQTHNELGRFAKEKQYGDLVEKKFEENKISYKRELKIGDSGNTMDFNVEDKIALELKAKPFLLDVDYSQIKRYLRASGLELGILVNFREKTLKPRRVLNVRKHL